MIWYFQTICNSNKKFKEILTRILLNITRKLSKEPRGKIKHRIELSMNKISFVHCSIVQRLKMSHWDQIVIAKINENCFFLTWMTVLFSSSFINTIFKHLILCVNRHLKLFVLSNFCDCDNWKVELLSN